MKRLLLTTTLALKILFVQAQVQIVSPCDSIDVFGSQSQLTMQVISGSNINFPLYIVTTDLNGYVVGEDSLTWTHDAWPIMALTDSIITCITYANGPDTLTCCVDFFWNGTFWVKMGVVTSIADCNGVLNGTSLLDSCGVCHSAYIYNFITHVPTFVTNANLLIPGVDYDPAQEIVVMPGDPGDPYWNAFCTGCTDSLASNYNPFAMIDDSSCCYSITTVMAIAVCDTFTWNGNIYTSSGVYTDTLITNNGCDSISIVDLSLAQTTFSYDTLFVTTNVYNWNGIAITTSGDYSYTFTGSAGCDSIACLHLVIANTTGVIDQINYKTLVKVTDILGKETHYRKNALLFFIYDDGTVQSKIILE